MGIILFYIHFGNHRTTPKVPEGDKQSKSKPLKQGETSKQIAKNSTNEKQVTTDSQRHYSRKIGMFAEE
jgi:hypothetical protein